MMLIQMMRITRMSCFRIPITTLRSFCQNVLSPSAVTAIACTSNSGLAEVKKEKPRKSSKEDKELKKIRNTIRGEIIKKLAFQLQKEQERKIRDARMRRALASVANFIRHEDFSNLIEYSISHYENTDRELKPDTFEDEICAVVLKYASSVHEGDWICATTVNESNKCTGFFPRFTDSRTDPNFLGLVALMSMVPLGDESRVAFALCLHWLDEWLRLESNSEVRDDFSPKLVELRRKFSAELLKDPKQPPRNQMMFSTEEYSIACQVAKACQVVWDPSKVFNRNVGYLGCSESLSSFSKSLCQSAASGSSSDSPFVLPNKTKEDYVDLFLDEIEAEEGSVLKIENFSRTSKLPSMEAMLERWGWKSKIESVLKEKRETLGDEELKSFLEHIDTGVCASQVMDCMVSIMSRSQNVVSLSQLQQHMSRVVLKLVRAKFLQKMGIEHLEIFQRMFSEYIKYYTGEANLDQANFSIREWWNVCAVKCGLDADFYAPFAKLISSPPDKLGSLLVSIVLDVCTMPRSFNDEEAAAMPCQYKAFYLQDISYEESALDVTKTTVLNMFHLRERLMSRIAAHEFENLYFDSDFLPMKLPPRPWLEHGTCGPLYSRPQKVVRDAFECKDVFINEKFAERLREGEGKSGQKGRARLVFDSLNNLGATPWMINKSVLNNVLRAFEWSADLNKIELLKLLKIPAHPSTVAVTTDKMSIETEFGRGKTRAEIPDDQYEAFIDRQKVFEREKQEATKKRNELCSLHTWLLCRLSVARRFQNDLLYFPHNMDFRGRVYPISPYINHMGDDVNRGLLLFAKGKKLGSKGFDWLKIHCINLTGLMKREPLRNRLEFAESKIADIIDSANNPFDGGDWWQKSDEPWQTLAACIEIRDALESGDPEQFISHLPIHQDGSCNGLQHYAALGRDYRGAFEVNLVPNHTPMDVYSSVCERVEKMRIEDERDPKSEKHVVATELRKIMPQPIPRKVLKQTVMTTVYGVTEYGARLQIKRQLKALDVDCDSKLFSGYLARNTFASLDEAFTTSMFLKKWFQGCARQVADLHQTMQWETPLGMPVFQPYLEAERRFGHLYLEPNKSKQVNAFPPNFVHSLDSTHMMLTSLFCRQKGLTFAAVHDCFWTHAGDVDKMNAICRDQFIALHEFPIIERLSEFLIKTFVEELPISEDEKKIISQKFIPNASPGTLNIKDIRNSVYFFS